MMQEQKLFELPIANAEHPAKYTDILLWVFVKMLDGRKRVLDPFGVTGKIFLLNRWYPNMEIQAVEIEPEWAVINPRTTLGNALNLPWEDGYFDAICTSPAYGNRMADKYCEGRTHIGYPYSLKRDLHHDNSGQMQWGEKYRQFHIKAWIEAKRVLCSDGIFVLNIKNHIRAGKEQKVTDWHIEILKSLGFRLLEHEKLILHQCAMEVTEKRGLIMKALLNLRYKMLPETKTLKSISDLPEPCIGFVCYTSATQAAMEFKAHYGEDPRAIYQFTNPTMKNTTFYIPKAVSDDRCPHLRE